MHSLHRLVSLSADRDLALISTDVHVRGYISAVIMISIDMIQRQLIARNFNQAALAINDAHSSIHTYGENTISM